MNLLEITDGVPRVDKVDLYDGTFLIPGVASVYLELEETRP
jgi:hypothetical protein